MEQKLKNSKEYSKRYFNETVLDTVNQNFFYKRFQKTFFSRGGQTLRF